MPSHPPPDTWLMRDQPVLIEIDGVWRQYRLLAWGRTQESGWMGLVETDPGASFGRAEWVPAARLRPVVA